MIKKRDMLHKKSFAIAFLFFAFIVSSVFISSFVSAITIENSYVSPVNLTKYDVKNGFIYGMKYEDSFYKINATSMSLLSSKTDSIQDFKIIDSYLYIVNSTSIYKTDLALSTVSKYDFSCRTATIVNNSNYVYVGCIDEHTVYQLDKSLNYISKNIVATDGGLLTLTPSVLLVWGMGGGCGSPAILGLNLTNISNSLFSATLTMTCEGANIVQVKATDTKFLMYYETLSHGNIIDCADLLYVNHCGSIYGSSGVDFYDLYSVNDNYAFIGHRDNKVYQYNINNLSLGANWVQEFGGSYQNLTNVYTDNNFSIFSFSGNYPFLLNKIESYDNTGVNAYSVNNFLMKNYSSLSVYGQEKFFFGRNETEGNFYYINGEISNIEKINFSSTMRSSLNPIKSDNKVYFVAENNIYKINYTSLPTPTPTPSISPTPVNSFYDSGINVSDVDFSGDLVDTEDINQGILPSIYHGILAFLSHSYMGILIIIIFVFVVLIAFLIGAVIVNLMKRAI